MSGKTKAKKKAIPKKVAPKKVAAPKKLSAAKPSAKKAAPPPKKAVAAVKAAPPKKEIKTAVQKRKDQVKAAMEDALKEAPASATDAADTEEFDPAAFFAASGGKGEFRAHIMRKERVDLELSVRYRYLNSPLVYNADLLNLSKGGLCLRTPAVVKNKTVLKIEIPLPHTSELFAVQAEVIWSDFIGEEVADKEREVQTGLRFMQMSIAKQSVINQFIQQRRDEVIMAKIGLDKFTDSVPVAGLD